MGTMELACHHGNMRFWNQYNSGTRPSIEPPLVKKAP
jgi:hypothetical protein